MIAVVTVRLPAFNFYISLILLFTIPSSLLKEWRSCERNVRGIREGPSHEKAFSTRHGRNERTGVCRPSQFAQFVGSTDARDTGEVSSQAADAALQQNVRFDRTSAGRCAGHPAKTHTRSTR